jgi:hypothetical protein
MDPAIAVSAIIARHRADVAMAVAAKMTDMNMSAAQRLLETVSDNAAELEQAAADIVRGTGQILDIAV